MTTEIDQEVDEVELLDNAIGVWDSEMVKNSKRKVLFFGGSGTGKTYCAATFPKPLFLDMEGGMASIRKLKPYRWPADPNKVATSFDHIKQFYYLAKRELARENPRFETIVIDSLNEMQVIIVKHVIEDYAGVGKRLYDDQPTQADYGKALRDFMDVFRLFLKLPCHVVFLAVEKLKQYEDDKSVPDLIGKKIAPEVLRLVGAVGYTHTAQTGDGDRIKYLVSFEDTSAYTAKDRYGIGPGAKPNDYSSIFGPLEGNKAKGTQ